MSAILRTGKFLRLVSGFARQQQFPGPTPSGPAGGGCKAGSGNQASGADCHLTAGWDSSAPFQAWSLQHLQSTLPVVASNDGKRKEEDHEDELSRLLPGHNVNRKEIESLLSCIPGLDRRLAHSQSVLVLRLCGKVLSADVPDSSTRTGLVNDVWTRLEEEMSVPMTIAHYNALLSVYLENDHSFCPEYVQNRLRNHSIRANKQTFEAFLTRYCLDGNMDGANRIMKNMRDRGYSISESAFHSLIFGHAKAGDLSSANGVLQSMRQNDREPNSGAFLALCQGCAKRGDLQGIESAAKAASDSEAHLQIGDFFEVIQELSQNGHKEIASKVLKMISKADFDKYEKEAKAAISKLVISGHEDVAFTILQTIHNNTSAKEFLEQLVRSKRPVTKLLWFAEEMNRLHILKGGFEILLQTALQEDNFSLSLKLAEIYVQDGHDFKIGNLCAALLNLCTSSLDVLSTVRAISIKLSEAEIKGVVLPKIEQLCCQNDSTQELLENISKTGIKDELIVRPLVDYLTAKNRIADARLVAHASKCFLRDDQLWLSVDETSPPADTEFKTPESKADFVQDDLNSPMLAQPYAAVAMVQVFDPISQIFQYCPLPSVCEMFLSQGRFWDLEQLLETSQGSYTQDDRKAIFLYTLQTYVTLGLYDKVIMLTNRLEAEGLAFDFPEYHGLMGQFAESVPARIYPATSTLYSSSSTTPYAASESSSYPPTPASEEEEQMALQAHYHKALKRSINDKNSDGALKAYRELKKTGKPLNVTESSTLIELLVKGEHVKEAAHLAESMLRKDTYPMPKIFRYLLNKLAANGEVDLMNRVGKFLSPKVKKEVSFDNRLCNAYLSAGKASEFLDLLEREVENVRSGNLQSVKDKFPRGGAMGLLENNPDLIVKYSRVAHKFIELDYIAPMNVLWTYYFINGRHAEAGPLWDKYVKDCPQIMFQKICQTARSQGSLEMASRLVTLLKDARVTSGAQGIAYSCLLDVMSQNGSYMEALQKLDSGLRTGVSLDDVNRTALIRLKNGLEKAGEIFPYEIPKKCNNIHEKCMSPSMQ